jgi:hypothetical protein
MVKMVAKNVHKHHLILVANNMTCTGNLNGLNTGGYKATFRALKVQVPFRVHFVCKLISEVSHLCRSFGTFC